MIILALDPGSNMGYALSRNGEIVASGVWNLKPGRFEGAGMRLIRLRNYLNEIHKQKIDMVAFEEVRRHLGVDAAHCYGGLLMGIQAWCEEQDPKVPYTGVPVASIKKRATGKGNSDKTKMLESAQAHWPDIEIVDDNQADAMWLSAVASEQYDVKA